VPFGVRLSQRNEPEFLLRVCQRQGDDQRSIEQSLFGFDLPDGVTAPVLVRVALVPLEAFQSGEELVEDTHRQCIWRGYTVVKLGVGSTDMSPRCLTDHVSAAGDSHARESAARA